MYNRFIITILILAGIFWLEGIFSHFKGRQARCRHALPNLVIGSLNGIISGFVFAGIIISTINWARANSL